ncbi:MAG TPA: UDP-3-O-(3-hydroxymyristoyl)glucosamine N-acyltransferase [Rhodocyclaceae bacterium]|nr:UDP-3-O-(3-hydroxymyristoyl)glucosamine N-acyltransferase [Rhodocyclaceae bacterium]
MEPIRLDEIVARLGGELTGDGSRTIRQIATLAHAGPDEISFLANPHYRDQLAATRAGAVILTADAVVDCPVTCIVSSDPYSYYAHLAQWLNPVASASPGIHPDATVDSVLPASVSVAAGARIGADVRIGEGTRIGPGCVIGNGSTIGGNTLLHANVTIYAGCSIGTRVIIHSGAVIGADGFGFARQREGEAASQWLKIPQIGGVVIGDDVEIGANTCIDRGALEDTLIEEGVKLDNLIQVGHNVKIGAHSALAGCVGIAGSAQIGRRCTVGGGAVILGHLTIADDVNISAGTLVAKSIQKAGTYTGTIPFLEHAEWLKNFARLRHLDAMGDKIRTLETRLAALEKKN